MSEQLWLELPPISETAPRRLMVCFHGAGSSPEEFAPVALSWQLKFPGATVLLMQGLVERSPYRWDWIDSRGLNLQQDGVTGQSVPSRLDEAVAVLLSRVARLQEKENFSREDTILIGFSQGGSLVLEAARSHGELFGIGVAYSARLTRPFASDERLKPEIHLIHGSRDPINPPVYARQLFDALNAAQASATLDLVEDGSHSINQDMIIAGTTRTMQTVFRRRKQARMKTLN